MNKKIKKIVNNVETVIKGKRDVIIMSLIPLITESHLIFQDIPGVGKSTLAEAIARSIDGIFRRIQFTADMLPSDITGITIFKRKSEEFEFKKGPIFANIILADEINRASPKTQSALLEAMNERTVTIDGVTYKLPKPFFVIATENPIEFSGTYPLPENELDRFMMSLTMGYPPEDIEKDIIKESEQKKASELEPVLTRKEILEIISTVKSIYTEDSIIDYIMRIVRETRNNRFIRIGVSIRGSIDFVRAAKGYAYISERNFVVPDDVKTVAPAVLSHRIVLKETERRFAKEIIHQILQNVQVPL